MFVSFAGQGSSCWDFASLGNGTFIFVFRPKHSKLWYFLEYATDKASKSLLIVIVFPFKPLFSLLYAIATLIFLTSSQTKL